MNNKNFLAHLAFVLATALLPGAWAATKTWSGGGATPNWSDGANWAGGAAPLEGDHLVFPDGVPRLASNNDLAVSLDGITVTNSTHGHLFYGPNTITLTGVEAIRNEGGMGIIFWGPVTLAAPSARITMLGNSQVRFDPAGELRVSGGTVTVDAGTGRAELLANIVESAPTSFHLVGEEILLTGNNTFTGTVTSGGSNTGLNLVIVDSNNGLGSAGTGTVMEQGTLWIGSSQSPPRTIAEPIVLRGPTQPQWSNLTILAQEGAGAVRLTGPIEVTGTQRVYVGALEAYLEGPITGTGKLSISSAGGTFHRTNLTHPGNSFSGGLEVASGIVQLYGTDVIPDSSAVTILPEGHLFVWLAPETVRSLDCRGVLLIGLKTSYVRVLEPSSINNCGLSVSYDVSYTFAIDEEVTLIRNDSGAPLGMFQGYPEGAPIAVNNGEILYMTYKAGPSGRDAAFVRRATPPPTGVAHVMPLGGNAQTFPIGTTAPQPFVARAVDGNNVPIPGAHVFMLSYCGTFAGQMGIELVADSEGFVTAPPFTAGYGHGPCFIASRLGPVSSLQSAGYDFVAYIYDPAQVEVVATPAALFTNPGQPFSFTLQAIGSNGLPMGVDLTLETLTPGAANASLPATVRTVIWNANRITVNGTANAFAGEYQIVVRLGARSWSIPVVQTGSAGIVGRIDILDGAPQSIATGETGVPYRVRVLSVTGLPMASVNVAFTMGAGCGLIAGALTQTVATNADGVATSAAPVGGIDPRICFNTAQVPGSPNLANLVTYLYKLDEVVLVVSPNVVHATVGQLFTFSVQVRMPNGGPSLPGLRVDFHPYPDTTIANVASLTQSAVTTSDGQPGGDYRAVAFGVANMIAGQHNITAQFRIHGIGVRVEQLPAGAPPPPPVRRRLITLTSGEVVALNLLGAHPTCALGDILPFPANAMSIPPTTPPGNLYFPYGFLRVVAYDCPPGADLTFRLDMPASTQSMRYWTFAPTAEVPAGQWLPAPTTTEGSSATFTLKDGGLGDHDRLASGIFIGNGGLALEAAGTSVAPFGDAQLFAMQQYRDFLGREGDAGGIMYYTNAINGGSLTSAQAIENFFNSPEFGVTVSPVVRLYFATFMRLPDYDGLLFQVNAFRSGAPLAEIADNFTRSPEFQARYGALDHRQFVALLYQNILGRAASPEDINFHVARLLAGESRGAVLTGFSEAPEFMRLTETDVYVTMMYVGMLRRAPEQAGFDYWVDYMEQGNSGMALITGFLNATEYRNRFR